MSTVRELLGIDQMVTHATSTMGKLQLLAEMVDDAVEEATVAIRTAQVTSIKAMSNGNPTLRKPAGKRV